MKVKKIFPPKLKANLRAKMNQKFSVTLTVQSLKMLPDLRILTNSLRFSPSFADRTAQASYAISEDQQPSVHVQPNTDVTFSDDEGDELDDSWLDKSEKR